MTNKPLQAASQAGDEALRNLSPPSGSRLAQEQRLLLPETGTVNLQLTGPAGWGRLELQVSRPVQLHITVFHEAIKNFSENQTGPYDEKNFTAFYVFPAQKAPRGLSSFWFEWWGLPFPNRPTLNAPRVEAIPDVPLVLLAATTVPGYSLRIGLADPTAGPTLSYPWALAPASDLRLDLPRPKVSDSTSTDLVHPQRQKSWTSRFDVNSPSIVLARGWSLEPPLRSRAGLQTGYVSLLVDGPGQGQAISQGERSTFAPGPASPIESNPRVMAFSFVSSSGSARVEGIRWLQESSVGWGSANEGFGVLAIPYGKGPPSA